MASSELILNPDGSVYHLGLLPNEIGHTILTVGDPDRVPKISKHFETLEVQKHIRELCTHTGTFKGQRITVISTGMGTDNIDIVLTELDALVNVDLKTLKPKKKLTSLRIIRLGTSGAAQPDIPLGSFLLSKNWRFNFFNNRCFNYFRGNFNNKVFFSNYFYNFSYCFSSSKWI